MKGDWQDEARRFEDVDRAALDTINAKLCACGHRFDRHSVDWVDRFERPANSCMERDCKCLEFGEDE